MNARDTNTSWPSLTITSKIRHNLIFKRAKFNKRVQLVCESAEQYITVLYHIAENCNYGELKSEMICDRVVVRIRDDHLSQQLKMDPKLTLDKAITRIRQKEAVQHHLGILRGNTCTRCGKAKHPRDKCPA